MKRFHQLQNRVPLGQFPTPIRELKNLGRELRGPRLYVKRDDQTGLGLGGNKVRKLEYIMWDALRNNADVVLTAGAQQSNHCHQTAAAAAFLGIECRLILGGEKPRCANGNLLLDTLFNARIHWAGDNRKGEDLDRLATDLRNNGRTPYIIPYGGSNSLGALGFVNAVHELLQQQKELKTDFTHIVFASSSGATHAGLLVGAKIFSLNAEIIGIEIDKEGLNGVSLKQHITDLTNATASFFEASPILSTEEIVLKTHYSSLGYGIVNKSDKEAIFLTARKEGLVLDPVYTGRAMAGLLDLIKKGVFKETDRILFWHTGGSPALFSYAEHFASDASS